MDLSSVPEDHFAALTSKIRYVKIQNVISLKLSCLRCPFLEISDQVLNTEETLALKKAMKFLRFLVLGAEGNVFLDLSALTKNDGKESIHENIETKDECSPFLGRFSWESIAGPSHPEAQPVIHDVSITLCHETLRRYRRSVIGIGMNIYTQ